MYYFESDLNTNLANNVPITSVDPADHQHMVTFTIAFGVTGSLDTTLYANCPLGACPDPWPDAGSDSGRIDDMFHAAVNGRGQFIAANNNEELIAALEALGKDIDSRLGSAAALATNSIQRQVGSVIYQGTYNTANWYGDVSALPLDLTTGNVGAPLWQASDFRARLERAPYPFSRWHGGHSFRCRQPDRRPGDPAGSQRAGDRGRNRRLYSR